MSLKRQLKTSEDNYILDLASSPFQSNIFASCCSYQYLRFFDIHREEIVTQYSLSLNNNQKDNRYSDESNGIPTSLCTNPQNPNVWYVSKRDKFGSVVMMDTRSPSDIVVYKANAPALAVSMNANGQCLVAGTELTGEDAKLVFWDPRMGPEARLTEFIEAHSDDITQVKFHPSRPELLMSGSTDGLITLYNLVSLVEDDAIHQTIKADSIHKLGYFGPLKEYIYSLTHTETFSLYKFENGDVIKDFGHVRSTCESQMQMDYLIDCQYFNDSQQLLLYSGTQDGNIGIWDVKLNGIQLMTKLCNGHGDVVRGLLHDNDHKMLSVGEDGLACVWEC